MIPINTNGIDTWYKGPNAGIELKKMSGSCRNTLLNNAQAFLPSCAKEKFKNSMSALLILSGKNCIVKKGISMLLP